MYDGIRGGGSYWYSIFFVACVGLGQFVALNLFLAVLLSNIDTNVSGVSPLSLLNEFGGRAISPPRADGLTPDEYRRPRPSSEGISILSCVALLGCFALSPTKLSPAKHGPMLRPASEFRLDRHGDVGEKGLSGERTTKTE